MPECYTNANIATQALMRSGFTVASYPALLAGANGPDPFFLYHYQKKRVHPNLRSLGARLQHEDTGLFLVTLLHNATTPVQQSYALGFITNYAASCTLNPYIAAMCAPGGPYEMNNGSFIMATALDSDIYFRDYKTRSVPVHAGTPVLITEELAQVTNLLRSTLLDVYGKDIQQVVLANMFHDNLRAHRLLTSRGGFHRLRLRVLSPRRPAKYGGPLVLRAQPGQRLKRLPQSWKNPYTHEEMNLTLEEVLAIAEQTAAACVAAAMRYLRGEVTEAQLADIIGNNDYFTGTPCKLEAGKQNG